MKNKLHLKKTIFILIVISLFSINISGQASYIKNRWNLKAGYSRYNTNKSINNKVVTAGNYKIEADYGILNLVEAGVYFGYSKFEAQKIDWIDSTVYNKNCPALFYGVNCNIQLLPLLVKENDFRFDLYLTGKFGGVYFYSSKGYFPQGHYAEYGLGGGVSFYLGKHLGLYAEYCFGKYYFKDDTKFRYGMALKF